jgi:SWI/SNF-related matrix-associated actin-dependent regulator of chromatin subfamily D
VELDRDSEQYTDGNLIEVSPESHFVMVLTCLQWHKTQAAKESDGFEIKRTGTTSVKAKIFLTLDTPSEKFKLSPDLSQITNLQVDTRPRVIMAMWQYIKVTYMISWCNY